MLNFWRIEKVAFPLEISSYFIFIFSHKHIITAENRVTHCENVICWLLYGSTICNNLLISDCSFPTSMEIISW